jgi:serine/threonine-protein kinase RsbW
VTGDYVLEGLAVPETLNLLHDLLERAGREHPDVDPSDLMLFETAVIEVAGNVVEHGRPPGHVTWAFRLSVHPDRLEATLSDSGEEYTVGTWGTEMPADLLQEDGRGLALATRVLHSLDYQRAAGANHWTMLRRRTQEY